MVGTAARAVFFFLVLGFGEPNSLPAFVLLTAILTVYGAPLAYGATLLVLWPAGAVLRDTGAFTWWSLTPIGMIAGGVLVSLVSPRDRPSEGLGISFRVWGSRQGAVTGWFFWCYRRD